MPKIVDHDQRREEIARAVWRLIVSAGMGGVSVRNVAREAGLSQGALRHYFASQPALLLFSMQQVDAQVLRRLAALREQGLPPRQHVRDMLTQVLPMDAQRRAELQVWWAFVTQAGSDSRLRAHAEQVYAKLRSGMLGAIRHLRTHDVLRKGLDESIEAERLYALVDGLALHAILKPDAMQPSVMAEVLETHLDSLCR